MRSFRTATRRLLPLTLLALVGCASFSNPTTFPAVPVRRLPEELLGKPREDQLDLPQALLRQKRPKEHLIDAGDILGVVLEDPLLPKTTAATPPVSLPPVGSTYTNIGIGNPIPVLDDGTVSLPILDKPVEVRGLTISEAQAKIRKAYLDGEHFKTDNLRLLITLYRPRHYHVIVVRQDSSETFVTATSQIGSKRGNSTVLELAAYENDVLTALTRSGGLPGNEAKNEVIIQRGDLVGQLTTMPDGPIPGLDTIRIPLRLRPGEPIPFTPKDIELKNGDILFVQSRDAEIFYTGGLLISGEYPLPRNYDLDVLTAVAQTRGPLANAGVNFNNLAGNIISQGLGGPSPSQLTVLRRAPNKRQIAIRVDLNRALQDPRERILVQPGDVLILQETMGESLTRYMTSTFRLNNTFRILNTSSATSTLTASVP